ncbi:DUF2878 domain-containing protein [Halomonas pacifica]|uniref:DUF2878 domain-containing protein n=1 Tax=Bisbaumannia pacifica TaxID=77098 RepID=UPI002359D100|nr:DUF2878 domain-containing protein [Halomonas pacifica]MDC8805290.1 DUF2878 domain-containing protein [Halomonas pacifica]
MTWRMGLNLGLFQGGWFACVLGGSLVALPLVAAILALHLRWLARPGEWRWLAGFAALGLAVDGGLYLAGGFDFGNDFVGVLPLWLWLLWPLFASLLHHGLAWLWAHPWLALLGGAIGAPGSYLLGARLAEVTLAPWLLPAQALIWGGLCWWLCRRLGPSSTPHGTTGRARP